MTPSRINYERVGLPAMRAAVGLIVDDSLGPQPERFGVGGGRARVIGHKIVVAVAHRPVSDMLAIELYLARLSPAALETLTCGEATEAEALGAPQLVTEFLNAAFNAGVEAGAGA